MNIIRTSAVELTSIPAIAYKQKLASGGAGLRILRLDRAETGIFTIDKRDGHAISYGKVDAALFPENAVDEALELTDGLPFSARGKLKVSVFEDRKDDHDVSEDQTEETDMVESPEYAALVSRYTDIKGNINYALLNKDFIQFASKSKLVAEMLAAHASEDEIVMHIVRDRASYLSGTREPLTDKQAYALIETFDEIDPRSAFKELKNYLRRKLVPGV